jgi:hypothetical protein
MRVLEVLSTLAQAETPSEGHPVLGIMVVVGIILLLCGIFGGPKKDRYLVSQETRVRKMK